MQHVGRAGDDALVHEELGGRRGRHVSVSCRSMAGGCLGGRGDGTARRGRRTGRSPRAGHARSPRIIPAMLLAIDIGNTNVTIGLLRSGALVATRRAATPPRASADAIACASVVPALTAHIESIAARRERPLTLALAGSVPIPIRTERPGEVGA